MALSKPLYNFMGYYFEQLYTNPIRTKSVSSGVVAMLANLSSQYLQGNKVINQDSLIAYGLFGLLFGGTFPHMFYSGLDRVIPDGIVLRLLVERLLYTPIYLTLSLYAVPRLEGKTHRQALGQLVQLYWPILKANWKWLTVLQYVNLRFVPPVLRVLVFNLIGFFWVIFISKKRQQSQQKGNQHTK